MGYETIDLNSFSGDVSGWIGQSYYGGSAECQNLFEFRLADDDKITGSGVSAKFYEDDVLFLSLTHRLL